MSTRTTFLPHHSAAVLCVAIGAIGLGACDSGAAPRQELLVAAASDLALAMPHLAAAFEEETGIRVTATLGSSGQIAQQVLQGAPIDVFLSADRAWVDRLADAGRLADGGRSVYAEGTLAIVTAAQAPAAFRTLEELGGAGVRRIAIANPEHAPYGRAAREALRRAGVWNAVAGRVVVAENVRQTLQFVGTGNVDAAVTALPLMRADDGRWFAVPREYHAPLIQEAAIVGGRAAEDEARRFVAFLTGPAGREILLRHRFVLPDDAP